MVFSRTLIVATALLSTFANALEVQSSISGGDAAASLARRQQHERLAAALATSANEERGLEDVILNNDTNALEARSSGKVGLAWNNNFDRNLKSFKTSHTKYIYTWSPWCPSEAKSAGLECCPMLWGDKHISAFKQQKYHGGKCAMGMNEVNVPGQSKMSPQHGRDLWNEYIRDLNKEGFLLVSPSVTSGQDGIDWLHEFFKICGGTAKYCNAKGLAVHYYGTTASDFKKWMNKFHSNFPGINIWVTEVACQNFGDPKHGQCNSGQVWNFMKEITEWMNETPWITAYFYFGMLEDMYNVNPDNRMITNSGYPNALGHAYLNSS